MTTLSSLLKRQHDLQTESFGVKLDELTEEAQAEYIRESAVALVTELGEALQEVGWKSWATKRFLNEDAYLKELVDLLHFWMNLVLATGRSPDELATRLENLYSLKHEINARRQAEGYDGVTGKCWSCKRALDDTGTMRVEDAMTCAACGASLYLVQEAL